MDVKLGLFTLTLFKKRVLRKIFGAERRQVPGARGSCIMRNRMISLVTKYSDDQIKNDMRRACGTYGVQT
jgi:hypothetical protein